MGTLWYKSRSVEWDMGFPAAGAQAFFFLGGVQGTPITVYTDAGESSPHPNPVVADGNGRWPAVFIPYINSYGVRVQTEANVPLWLDSEIPNPNPVDVSVTIPPEQQVQTGMVHWEPVQGTRAAYVRCNGRTIGTAASGATERANGTPGEVNGVPNSDCRNLFIYLYNAMADGQAPVSGGRTPSGAAADFDANKTIKLPDLRAAGPYGLDDMGSTAAGFYPSPAVIFSNGSAILPGSATGINAASFPLSMMPAHSHTGITDLSGAHSHTGATGNEVGAGHKHNLLATSVGTNTTGDHSHTTTAGGGTHLHTMGTMVVPATGLPSDHTHLYDTRTGLANPTQGAGAPVNNVWTGVGSASSSGASENHTHILDGGAPGGAHTHLTTTGGAHAHTVSGVTESPISTHTHAISEQAAHTHGFTTDIKGESAPFNNLSRVVLGTWYIKL